MHAFPLLPLFFLILIPLLLYFYFIFIFLAPLNPCSILVGQAQAPVPDYWDGCAFTEHVRRVFECRRLDIVLRSAEQVTEGTRNGVGERRKAKQQGKTDAQMLFLSPR